MHQSPLEPNPMLDPRCQAESREVIKNLILVGTIIMLVASVRQVFCYLSSSSVTFTRMCESERGEKKKKKKRVGGREKWKKRLTCNYLV